MPAAGNYLRWITLCQALPQIGVYTSIGLGSTVLFLNFCGAQKQFGPYKYILNSFTILGMIFAIVDVIVYPNVHNYNAGFIVFTFVKPFGISDLNELEIILASYTFFYAATIALLSTQFIYRYWELSEPYYYGTCIDLLDRFPFEKTAKIILQPQLLTLNYLKTHLADK
ncbi:Protein CBG01343 [Caenorhabditis briggsae]|uniref:Protein CBG01343 n=1 Tax=Caenorhabditis briggsae TaxID=6238 RepID=A8WQ68_CAEBR|nr:Protein CBG01343 [Caenorhabditis briggsae]CAP22626.2 Protein CBG01343 [Caenorhabditis briggsae]